MAAACVVEMAPSLGDQAEVVVLGSWWEGREAWLKVGRNHIIEFIYKSPSLAVYTTVMQLMKHVYEGVNLRSKYG